MRYKNLFGQKQEEPILKTRSPENKEKKAEYEKKWRLKNPEKVREWGKRSRLKNKEKIKERDKKYRLKNKEKIKERMKKWRLKNPEKVREWNKKWRLENPERSKELAKRRKRKPAYRYRRYKESARERGLEWELTLEVFTDLISKPCGYCGEKKEAGGVDRINNKKGYVPGNMVSCCKLCNFQKGVSSEDDFLKHCKKVALFQEKKKEIGG